MDTFKVSRNPEILILKSSNSLDLVSWCFEQEYRKTGYCDQELLVCSQMNWWNLWVLESCSRITTFNISHIVSGYTSGLCCFKVKFLFWSDVRIKSLVSTNCTYFGWYMRFMLYSKQTYIIWILKKICKYFCLILFF